MKAVAELPPLFQPAAAGLEAQSWDELETAAEAALPKCSECDRRLRSRESQEAGIGPCCAAKIGRAVARKRRRKAKPAA